MEQNHVERWKLCKYFQCHFWAVTVVSSHHSLPQYLYLKFSRVFAVCVGDKKQKWAKIETSINFHYALRCFPFSSHLHAQTMPATHSHSRMCRHHACICVCQESVWHSFYAAQRKQIVYSVHLGRLNEIVSCYQAGGTGRQNFLRATEINTKH